MLQDSKQVNFSFGITASKKTGNAVKRNWCKRTIRVLVQKINLDNPTQHLYINVIARKCMLSKNFLILKDDFDYCIKKILKHEEKI